MALLELNDTAALQQFLSTNKNVVMTFSAHWCGPCKASKPALEALAQKYAADSSHDVKFGIVYESDIGEDIHKYAIKAFPTYVLFQNSGTETNRVEGVNMDGIEAMIAGANTASDFTGSGQTLAGSGGAALSPAEAREARLAKLGAAPAPPVAAPAPAPAVDDVEMKDASAAAPKKDDDGDSKMEDAAEPEMIDPAADLNPELIASLTDNMGFSKIRAQKGLLNGNARTVEAAVEWLLEHQEDADIDEPIALQPKNGSGVAGSYKCNECGKILSNMANLEMHANKTGHSDFEESTHQVTPLTPEEKIKKLAQIKELLKSKRAEREEEEKVDLVAREKSRRFMGQEVAKTREQMESAERKRDAKIRSNEKSAAIKERNRIRAELENDKRERKANKGRLNSKLGIDGYNPSAIQYNVDADGQPPAVDEGNAPAKKKVPASAAKIDEYIAKVASYRAGGDGGPCLKLLKTFVGNVADTPDEDKFKRINMEGKAYKAKVKPFVGAKLLLMAVGFTPNEKGTHLELNEDYNIDVLKSTKAKLEAAFAAY